MNKLLGIQEDNKMNKQPNDLLVGCFMQYANIQLNTSIIRVIRITLEESTDQ
jgi:hypothetical protein